MAICRYVLETKAMMAISARLLRSWHIRRMSSGGRRMMPMASDITMRPRMSKVLFSRRVCQRADLGKSKSVPVIEYLDRREIVTSHRGRVSDVEAPEISQSHSPITLSFCKCCIHKGHGDAAGKHTTVALVRPCRSDSKPACCDSEAASVSQNLFT